MILMALAGIERIPPVKLARICGILRGVELCENQSDSHGVGGNRKDSPSKFARISGILLGAKFERILIFSRSMRKSLGFPGNSEIAWFENRWNE